MISNDLAVHDCTTASYERILGASTVRKGELSRKVVPVSAVIEDSNFCRLRSIGPVSPNAAPARTGCSMTLKLDF